MADSEIIGGVSITVGVDTSEMDAAFAAALAKAVADGNSIAQALENAVKAPDISGISGSVDQIEARFRQLAQEMAQALGITLPAPDTSAVTGALQGVEDAAKQTGDAFSAADPAIKQAGQDLNQTGAAAAAAKDPLAGVADQLAKLAGISLSAQGIVSFAESIGEAFDSLTKADIVLTRLTGDADQAAEMISKLEALGTQDGLAMPGLLQAAEKMERLVPAGTDIVGILSQLADAATVTGGSIEGMASKFDMLVDSGKASDKSLATLGLDMNILKEAMSTAGVDLAAFGDNAKQAFAALDQHDRIVVLQTALQDLGGVAQDVAENTFAGKWHQALAQWDQDLGIVQKDMQPVADSFGSLKPIVNDIAAVLVTFATSVKATVDQIVGFVSLAVTAFTGLASAIKSAATGDVSGALASLKDAFANIGTVAASMGDSLKTDLGGGLKTVQDLLNQTTATVKPTIDSLDNLGSHGKDAIDKVSASFHTYDSALRDFVDVSAIAVDDEQALLDKTDALQAKYESLSTSVYHAQQNLDNALSVLRATQAGFDNGTNSANDLAVAEQNVATWSNKLTGEQQALAKAQADLDAAWNTGHTYAAAMNEALSQLAGASLAAGDDLRDLGVDLDPIPPKMSALNQALIDSGAKLTDFGSRMSNIHPNAVQLETDIGQLLTLANNAGAGGWDKFSQGLEGLDKWVAQLAKTDLPVATSVLGNFVSQMIAGNAPLQEIQTQMGLWEADINKLAKSDLPDAIAQQGLYIAALNNIHAPISDIIAATEQWDNWQIKLATDSGTSADQYVYNLEKMKLKQEELALDAHGMSDSVVSAINDTLKGFDALGKSIGDAIVNGKNLGDALVTEFKKIAASILGDLIQGALKPLEKELIDLISSFLPDLDLGFKVAGESAAQLQEALKNEADAVNAVVNSDLGLAKSTDQVSSSMGEVTKTSGALSSSFTSLIGAIGAIIGAIAGIVGDVYLAAIDSKLFITNTTLAGIKNEAENLRADQWSQYNHMYDRLGEVKNDLDSIMDNIAILAGGGGGSVTSSGSSGGSTVQGDLDLLVLSMQNTERNTGSTNTSVQVLNQTTVSWLQNIVSVLMDINTSLYKINTSILEGHSQSSSNSQLVSDQIRLGANAVMGNATDNASGILHGLDDVNQSIGQQIATAQQQLAAAEQAAQAATDIPTKIQALQQALAADLLLVQLEEKNGNSLMSTIYQQGADSIKQQLAALGVTVTTDTGNLGTTISNSGNQTSATVSGTATTITNAVSGSGASIVQAVNNAALTIGAAVQATAATIAGSMLMMSGVRAPTSGAGTGGSTPGIAPGNEAAQQPTQGQVQAGGTGATVVGQPPPSFPQGSGQMNVVPLGAFPDGHGGWTWPSGAPQNPQTGVVPPPLNPDAPHFATGGMIEGDGALVAEKGEAVLTPDQATTFKTFATAITNPMPGIAPGAPPQTAGQQQASAAAQLMADKLDLLKSELATSLKFGGKDNVQTQELQMQIADLLKQIAGDTKTTADNTDQSKAPPGGPRVLGPPDQAPMPDFPAILGVPGVRDTTQPPPGSPKYFDPGTNSGAPPPGSPKYFDPRAGAGGTGTSWDAQMMALGTKISAQGILPPGNAAPAAPPPTPHNVFSGYNPYGSSQPFALGAFEMGGQVPSTGLYQLHANEEVLAPDLSKSLRQMVGGNGGSASGKAGSPMTFNVNLNVSQVQDGRKLAQQFVSHMKTIIPAGAFGQ